MSHEWDLLKRSAQRTAREVIDRGKLQDNTAQVRSFNDQVLQEMRIPWEYTLLDVITAGVTTLTLDRSREAIVLNTTQDTMWKNDNVNGFTGVGTCFEEANVKAQIINASTIHDGKLVAPYIFHHPNSSNEHVRVARIDTDDLTALVSEIPPRLADSTSIYDEYDIRTDRTKPFRINTRKSLLYGKVTSFNFDEADLDKSYFLLHDATILGTTEDSQILLGVKTDGERTFVVIKTLSESEGVATAFIVVQQGKKSLYCGLHEEGVKGREVDTFARAIFYKLRVIAD